MQKDLELLSESIVEIYQKNLAFLEENFKDLYDEIDQLSKRIDTNEQKEKYTLEFVDGYFDILNNENNGYYYFTNSFEDADQRAEVVTFDTSNSLDLLRKNPNTNKLISSAVYKDVAPIIDHINEVVDFDNVKFGKIFKMIYMGTGLGLHIQQIDKKINSFTTLIMEKELEIFRLSLFVTDYTVLQEGNRKVFFCIGDSSEKLTKSLDEFTDYHKYMNYNIKYNTLLSDEVTKNKIVQYYATNSSTSFPYKLILQNLERLVGFIKDGERLLNVPVMRKELILEDKKVLMVAAGPSLDNYIEWIKEHQDKFIIVAADVITRKLEKNNIVPEIIVSIDPLDVVAEFLHTENPHFLDNTAHLFLSQQSAKVMEQVKDKHCYFSQAIPLINEVGYLGSTPNVGTYSFELAVYLGAKELYTIGNDAAFDQKTGERYSSDAAVQSKLNKDIMLSDSKDGVNKTDVLEVKGNLRDTIKTNLTLNHIKDNFEEAVRGFKNSGFKLEVYNLSDGAYMEGMEPLTKEEMTERIKSFEIINVDIIEQLDSVSKVIENTDFGEDIVALTTVINRLKSFEKIRMKSKDNFLENKLDMMIWILEQTKVMSTNLYSNLFLTFSNLSDIYVNYLLNLRQNNLHNKEEINKVSKMWAKGAVVLFKDIKNSLKRVDG